MVWESKGKRKARRGSCTSTLSLWGQHLLHSQQWFHPGGGQTAWILHVLLRFRTQIIYKRNQLSITWFQTLLPDSHWFHDRELRGLRIPDVIWGELDWQKQLKLLLHTQTLHILRKSPAAPNKLYFWFWEDVCAAGRCTLRPAVLSHRTADVCPFWTVVLILQPSSTFFFMITWAVWGGAGQKCHIQKRK